MKRTTTILALLTVLLLCQHSFAASRGNFYNEYDVYRNLSSYQSPLTLRGTLLDRHQNIEQILKAQSFSVYQIQSPGHYSLYAQERGELKRINLFAPPIPSMINGNSSVDWYRTQFNTVTPSNCGPASVAMAVTWATGEPTSVYSIRYEIGWSGRGAYDSEAINHAVQDFFRTWDVRNNGGTDIYELMGAIQRRGVSVREQRVHRRQDLFDVLDRGNIALVLFETGDISRTRGNPIQNLVGRHYDYAGGHYVIVKGYSLDGQYFIVQDPMPSDWSSNSLRHFDQTSMVGRSRYYKASELFPSIRSRHHSVLEISR